MSEAAVPSFQSYSYDIFGITGGSVLILVMIARGNFTFNWVLTLKTSLY